MIVPAKDSLDLGVICTEVEACLEFYQNVLGLEFIEKVDNPFGTLYRLRFGQSDFKLLVPKSKPPQGPRGLMAQAGFRYVTFVVKNLAQICAALKERGVEFSQPETEIRPGTRIAMVYDPQGNVVEFVERG